MSEHYEALEEASETLKQSEAESFAIITFDSNDSDIVVDMDNDDEWEAQHLIGLLNLCETRVTEQVLSDE
jgi:hypothetical protein